MFAYAAAVVNINANTLFNGTGVVARGGVPPYTYALGAAPILTETSLDLLGEGGFPLDIESGNTNPNPLPYGMYLDKHSGLILGQPTQTGVFIIYVTATDSNGNQANTNAIELVVTGIVGGIYIVTNTGENVVTDTGLNVATTAAPPPGQYLSTDTQGAILLDSGQEIAP